MRYRRGLNVPVAALLATLTGCVQGQPESSSPPEIRSPLLVTAPAPVTIAPRDGTSRLAHAEHPFARPDLDVGRLDPDTRLEGLSMFFQLSPEQRKDRDGLAAALVDPSSPSFHRWLTPETYRARFGARPRDIERASTWLAQQGLEVRTTGRLGTRVTFSGKVGTLEAAFQTERHRYRVGGDSTAATRATSHRPPRRQA